MIMPKKWTDITVNDFLNHLSNIKLTKVDGKYCNALIDPPFSEVYWDMCRENSWLSPSQEEFIEQVMLKCHLVNSCDMRYRIGYLAFPALIRQHHFGLKLVDMLGTQCVVGGVLLDASYGVDWAVTYEEDIEARIYAIHLSVDTWNAKKHERDNFHLHVKQNIYLRVKLNKRDALHVGMEEGFFLHPDSDLEIVLNILRAGMNDNSHANIATEIGNIEDVLGI